MTQKPLSLLIGLTALALNACGPASAPEPEPTPEPWTWVAHSQAAALLSVHGTAQDDVWLSGADDGKGPVVLHFNGQDWERKASGTRGDFWWVHALQGGPVFFGGTDASLIRYENDEFVRLPTPGLGKHTVFGIWAAAQDDVYAVGSVAGKNGFIWHYDGEKVVELALPSTLPENEDRDEPGLFKVWGTSAQEVWVVGGNGVVLRGNVNEGFELERTGGEEILFTVHGSGDEVVFVGGGSSGMLLESSQGEFKDLTPESAPLLQGACVEKSGRIWAVGVGGSIYRGDRRGFAAVDPGLDFGAAESLHAVWVDPKGGVWAAGGDVLTPELDQGLALYSGKGVAEIMLEPDPSPAPSCPEIAVDPVPEGSIARRWDEQILNAIRRDIPRPGVHARNLFHLSVAMWDAFAAYDSLASGYLLSERLSAEDVDAARAEAISYAAYRVLSHRYQGAIGGPVSQGCFDAFMQRLGYDPSQTGTRGDSPRALGNRVGRTLIEHYASDGANEAENYADPEGFLHATSSLVVDRPGAGTDDPLKWQPLILAKAETQNGIPAGAGAQGYIGSHWGQVTPFSLVRAVEGEPYLDIGEPPLELDERLVEAAVDAIRRSSELDASDATEIDISPGALGNNPLGTNDGTGHELNPVTGVAYTPQRVLRGDFGRVLAEFWADGPTSETPPGHWNTIANSVADDAALERRLFGSGETLDALAWDVHVYLALNAAVHDAGIAAWELKRKYVTSRPITLIRYMAEQGQRSNRGLPGYSRQGLPLEEGLIELISEESSAPGERHAHLARFAGEVAVRSWRGEPGSRKAEVGGVAWVRALEWMPYQRRTFVTPAFPGYVSGHSTFSRAAAVVLAGITGSDYFPGGYASQTFEPGYLFFEKGPKSPLRLEWATYFDAADQAGQSRVWGGIHVSHDDFDGRRIGAEVGASALLLARSYFDGTALPVN